MLIMGCVDENHKLIKVDQNTTPLSQQTDYSTSLKTNTNTSPVSMFNHHQARTAGPLQSTRWSPTAKQLMALEELYRNGTRTPTAHQIQEITAKLRRFGKIEGKNVFYWFQNHKARDKKKQRLKMEAAARSNLNVVHNHHYSKTFDHINKSHMIGSEGARVTSLEVEQTKREPLSNCGAVSEESASAPRGATTTTPLAETRTKTTQVKEEIKQYYYPSWNSMEMPFCFPIINLLGTTKPTTVIPMASSDQKLLERSEPLMTIYNTSSGMNCFSNEIKQSSTIQTLELFPLHSDNLKARHDKNQDTKHLPFGSGICGLIQSDLSLSLLVSMEH